MTLENISAQESSSLKIQDKVSASSSSGHIKTARPKILSEDKTKMANIEFLVPYLQSTLENKTSRFIPIIEQIQNTDKKATTKWQFSAMTGINSLAFKFKSTNSPAIATLKTESENMYGGSSFSTFIETKLKNKWTLGSGFEYHQLWTKFDYQASTTDQIIKEDVLLLEWQNASTGDVLYQIYGDTTINVTNNRKITHYNNYRRLSIPLTVGLQKQTNKLNYGISIGPILNLNITQSGKTLDPNEEIVLFSNDDIAGPFNKIDLGIIVSPSLGYNLTSNWQLKINPQWRWSQSKYYDSNYKVGIHQLNLNVGLGYQF